jgi:PHD/YefM family antitoxin component YafN of YafNO toxin-antitoxin module
VKDRTVDLASLAEELKGFVRECEVTGRRTVFTRQNKSVAAIVSYDEYLALRETVELSEDPELLSDIVNGEEEAKRGALLLPEDLFVE